jgi:hypothetical protein
MREPEPRWNCASCGATCCLDHACCPDVLTATEVFVARIPPGLFAGSVPASRANASLWSAELRDWGRTVGAEREEWLRYVLIAASRKYARVCYAVATGDFSGWPTLDAAYRLGGYRAAYDLLSALVPERPS